MELVQLWSQIMCAHTQLSSLTKKGKVLSYNTIWILVQTS